MRTTMRLLGLLMAATWWVADANGQSVPIDTRCWHYPTSVNVTWSGDCAKIDATVCCASYLFGSIYAGVSCGACTATGCRGSLSMDLMCPEL
jgi:hypothetical protein